MTDKLSCDQSRLTALLNQGLSDAESEQLEEHLKACPACRSALELQAADAGVWEQAASALRDDEDDLEKFSVDRDLTQASPAVKALLAALAPTDDPQRLGRLGPYEIAGVIGSGGMGIVLKAFDPALSRFVALKVLSPDFWDDPQARRRFSREARAAASVVHDNVIEIYGVAEADGVPYFTMPYLRGDTLQQRVERCGPLAIDDILRIGLQIARGLAAAHAQGLVHRDIKPANILLSHGAERVHITDFGLAHAGGDARLTQTGVVAGTPQYMSPEQVRGETLDQRSDLFSLGGVLYTLCTGRPPFQAESNYELFNQVVAAAPRRIEESNPAVPEWLAAVVDRLLAAAPQDRYQSADELARHLEQCLAHRQQPQKWPQPRGVTRLAARYRRSRRRRVTTRRNFLAAGAVMALGAAWLLAAGNLPMQATEAAGEFIKVTGRVVDTAGEPLAGVTVLAIQKTWPNNRYRQQALQAKSDKEGRFRFEKFAEKGGQYAFLLTVLSDQHALASVYRVVKDGSQQEPVTLRVESAEPVTIEIKDQQGKPIENALVLPSRRTTADKQEHLVYSQHLSQAGKKTDAEGRVRLAAWKPGESGRVYVGVEGDASEHKLDVPESRVVSLAVERVEREPVHVTGRVVDDAGRPIAGAPVVAIRKRWPNNRYRQEALQTKTDAEGKFRFDDFAKSGRQYAVLATVVADGYTLVSRYLLVRDGTQQPPMELRTERAKPVTLVLQDADGKPVEGARVCPSERQAAGKEYINYYQQMEHTGKTTDAAGRVEFTSWKPGETGAIWYRHGDAADGLEFLVTDERQITLKLK